MKTQKNLSELKVGEKFNLSTSSSSVYTLVEKSVKNFSGIPYSKVRYNGTQLTGKDFQEAVMSQDSFFPDNELVYVLDDSEGKKLFDPIEVTEKSFTQKVLICPFLTKPYIIGKLETGELVCSSDTEKLKDYFIINEELYSQSIESPLTNNIIDVYQGH